MRTVLQIKLWYEYLHQKVSFASLLTLQKHSRGQIVPNEVWSTVLKNFFSGQMIYCYRNKGMEMEPTISAQDSLLVRKLPYLNTRFNPVYQHIYVGDVVVLKDPKDSNNHVIRRVAAVEGHEMVSAKEEDKPFIIEHGQCWVLSDNKKLKPMESKDSRIYGPISMTDIVGRVVYRFRSVQDNDYVVNNERSMDNDLPVLYVELNSIELQQFAEKDEESQDY